MYRVITMIPFSINIEEKIQELKGPWSPIEIAEINDSVIRLALFEGEYHWHVHEEEDELFYVYRGEIIIQMRGHPSLMLRDGEVGVVPKGMEHCPKSDEKSYVLMFERKVLQSRGD